MSNLICRAVGIALTWIGISASDASAGPIAEFQFRAGEVELWQQRADQNEQAFAALETAVEILAGIPWMTPEIGFHPDYQGKDHFLYRRWSEVLRSLPLRPSHHWREPRLIEWTDPRPRNRLTLHLVSMEPAGWDCPWNIFLEAGEVDGEILVPAKRNELLYIADGVTIRAKPNGKPRYAEAYWRRHSGEVERAGTREVHAPGKLHLIVSGRPIEMPRSGQQLSSRGAEVQVNPSPALDGPYECTLSFAPLTQ